ncbi:hypothetical protein LZ31DRAFT_47770 [Colletotrichum somersetense]|nr:hypothetical protein LZ31DRAFT_47770 [Colletotrichum somersetense]
MKAASALDQDKGPLVPVLLFCTKQDKLARGPRRTFVLLGIGCVLLSPTPAARVLACSCLGRSAAEQGRSTPPPP